MPVDMHAANMPPANKLPVIIVPGFHERALTDGWVRSLPSYVDPYIADTTVVSPVAVYDWIQTTVKRQIERQLATDLPTPPVVAIGFSAGVVGLAGAVALWNQQRNQQSVDGQVVRLIAVDGWGVPVLGVPVTRISHDRFTHVSSLPLGAGDVNFYADPPVAHLDLWHEPEAAEGWQVERWSLQPGEGIAMTAAEFLRRSLHVEWKRAFSWRYSSQ